MGLTNTASPSALHAPFLDECDQDLKMFKFSRLDPHAHKVPVVLKETNPGEFNVEFEPRMQGEIFLLFSAFLSFFVSDFSFFGRLCADDR